MTDRRGRSGGAGAAGGFDFQSRLIAAIACDVLAEAHAVPRWDWPQSTTLTSVYAETGNAVDDLLVTNSDGAHAFVQAKAGLAFGSSISSEFGKTVAQFVKQELSGYQGAPLGESDRLVLAVDSTASGPIREQLPRILQQLGSLPPGVTVDTAFDNASAADREKASALVELVRESWRSEAELEPTEDELITLFRRMRVSEYNLQSGGHAADLAQTSLRQTILQTPSEAGAAWQRLVALGLSFCTNQTGADRPGLQRALVDNGISVAAAPSYRVDIERLRAHTSANVQKLERLAAIAVGGGPVKIERELASPLLEAIESGSLIVTGDPGAGKSAALYECVTSLISAGRDVVVLTADSLSADSIGELRGELGLTHEVDDVLKNWPGDGQAILVIDALDAARGDDAQAAIRDLIGRTLDGAERWDVVASMRRFDLRYSQALRVLFAEAGDNIDIRFIAGEFAGVRHFVTPNFSDDELSQLQSTAPTLASVLDSAPSELKNLARNPFNLRLLSELLEAGVATEELEPITTQVELLDKYWETRVVTEVGPGADARVAAVRQIVDLMVASKSMHVNRDAIDSAHATSISELLGSGVLEEQMTPAGSVSREVLTFAHHVLFDAAVDRTMLRGTAGRMAEAAAEQPELLLVVRPSFDLHFRHLWQCDGSRAEFWAAAIDLAGREGVPEFGKLIAPVVAARLVEEADDLAPLLEALTDDDRRQGAENVLRHLVGSLTSDPAVDSWPDSRLDAWTGFLQALAALPIRPEIAYPMRQLLAYFVEDDRRLTEEQLSRLGVAARTLFEFFFEQKAANRALIRPTIQGVVRTYESDSGESERLLRSLLEDDRVRDLGYIEVPELADHAATLAERNPGLAVELYKVAFGYVERSEEATPMGGIVMPLTSNRRQDFQHSHYTLDGAFPQFLAANPLAATEALVAVRTSYAENRGLDERTLETVEIPWGERSVTIAIDYARIWDNRPDRHDYEVKMLNAFEETFESLVESNPGLTHEIVDYLSAHPVPAAIWKRILSVAARHPEQLAQSLLPFVTSPEALTISDLRHPIGEFLGASFPHLDEPQRLDIETAVNGLPAYFTENEEQYGERALEWGNELRDRYLGRLQIDELVDEGSRSRLSEMVEADDVPPNDPPASFEMTSSAFGEREDLVERGVDVDADPNRQIRELEAPVKDFADKYLNETPGDTAINEINEPLAQLWAAVQTAEADGVDPEQGLYAWGRAADAAAAISRYDKLAEIEGTADLVRSILVEAANHPGPEPHDEIDAQFDEHPSWGSPAPRVEAAEGLPCLASNPALINDDVIAAIDRLRNDPVPAVRYQVARRVSLLRETAPELMTAIVDDGLASDPSTAVQSALVSRLPAVLNGDFERLGQMTADVFTATAVDGRGSETLRNTTMSAQVDLWIWKGQSAAGEFVEAQLLDEFEKNVEVARHAVVRIRDCLIYGEDGGEDAEVRARAIRLHKDVLERALGYLEEQAKTIDQSDEEALKHLRAVAGVIDGVGMNVYFCSGAFESSKTDPPISTAQSKRLYKESNGLLEILASAGHPQVTYHLVEAIEQFIPFDPRGAFMLLAQAIEGGKAGNYQLDGMAVNLFVRIIERYFADYRTLIQRDDEVRDHLMKMLDTFVDAGWPQAHQLTYGLHELFR